MFTRAGFNPKHRSTQIWAKTSTGWCQIIIFAGGDWAWYSGRGYLGWRATPRDLIEPYTIEQRIRFRYEGTLKSSSLEGRGSDRRRNRRAA